MGGQLGRGQELDGGQGDAPQHGQEQAAAGEQEAHHVTPMPYCDLRQAGKGKGGDDEGAAKAGLGVPRQELQTDDQGQQPNIQYPMSNIAGTGYWVLGMRYGSTDQPFAQGQHERQPGSGIDHAWKDPMGHDVAAPAVGQAGHQCAKAPQAQRPPQVVGAQPGQGHVQRQLPAKCPLDRHDQEEQVGRIKGRRLQVGCQGRACPQVRVPQGPLPGADLFYRQLAPGVELEQINAPVENLPAEKKRCIEDGGQDHQHTGRQ